MINTPLYKWPDGSWRPQRPPIVTPVFPPKEPKTPLPPTPKKAHHAP